MNKQAVIYRAVQAVRNALVTQGMGSQQAFHYAREILSHKGVELGQGGKIFYNGKRYSPDAFAKSPLAQLATGATAAARNKAAITGDPTYIQDLANLGLQRDQATAGLQDQQRQALIQFGDPTFAGSDAATAAEAAANPFSTTRLQAQQYGQAQAAAREAANRYGTLFGGGAISGQQDAQRTYSGQIQDTATKLQQLLASITQEQAAAQQAYGVGQTGAYTDVYNQLLASGALHAAQPPKWAIGPIAVRGYGGSGAGHGGGGGVAAAGGGTLGAAGGGGGTLGPIMPRPPTGPVSGPVYPPNPGLPPPVPGNGYQPWDQSAMLRRYGVGG